MKLALKNRIHVFMTFPFFNRSYRNEKPSYLIIQGENLDVNLFIKYI